ncbi:hypothetical protein PG985_011112 [Apiospora marii]|uniref:uncharacterized protein n=1 Tax=Apiospora marii TaxID=335849 RepID=UPI00312EC287
MADLGALEVLPTELLFMILEMANVQTVCRFSQVNRRAQALVGGLSIGLDRVRALFPRERPRPCNRPWNPCLCLPGLADPVRVATSDVWSYGILASLLCKRPNETSDSAGRSTGCGTCRRCVDRCLATLSVVLLGPEVEERIYEVDRVIG